MTAQGYKSSEPPLGRKKKQKWLRFFSSSEILTQNWLKLNLCKRNSHEIPFVRSCFRFYSYTLTGKVSKWSCCLFQLSGGQYFREIFQWSHWPGNVCKWSWFPFHLYGGQYIQENFLCSHFSLDQAYREVLGVQAYNNLWTTADSFGEFSKRCKLRVNYKNAQENWKKLGVCMPSGNVLFFKLGPISCMCLCCVYSAQQNVSRPLGSVLSLIQ